MSRRPWTKKALPEHTLRLKCIITNVHWNDPQLQIGAADNIMSRNGRSDVEFAIPFQLAKRGTEFRKEKFPNLGLLR